MLNENPSNLTPLSFIYLALTLTIITTFLAPACWANDAYTIIENRFSYIDLPGKWAYKPENGVWEGEHGEVLEETDMTLKGTWPPEMLKRILLEIDLEEEKKITHSV